ncbi:MAG: hypothetical protein AMXMBFR33_17100 [Candidatus Xenobia bacterium]|jgi:type II secretory pathway pseudopilin PulG
MRRRGFTVVETIFTAGLLGLLLAALALIFRHGLWAHQKGELSRRAQSTCRDVIDKMASELRTAVIIPGFEQTIDQIPVSAVLFPGPYSDFDPAFGPFYARTQVANPVPGAPILSVVKNRLIFTRSGTDVDINNIDSTNNFVYVEYVVDQGNPRVLLRRVYRVASGPGAAPGGHEFQGPVTQPTRARAVISYFYPGNDANLVGPSINPENQPVAVLPNPLDRIEFEVAQPKIPAPPNQPDVFFEPNLLTLTVRVTLTLREFVSVGELKTDVNLQSRPGSH